MSSKFSRKAGIPQYVAHKPYPHCFRCVCLRKHKDGEYSCLFGGDRYQDFLSGCGAFEEREEYLRENPSYRLGKVESLDNQKKI